MHLKHDLPFEIMVKYIYQNCSNNDDCYYLVKALWDINTLSCIFKPDFLDTKSAKSVRDYLFLSPEEFKNEQDLNTLENQSLES